MLCGYLAAFSFVLVDTCFANQLDGTANSTNGKQTLVESLWTRAGTDWPQFLGPNTDGRSDEKNILTDWSAGKLKVRWSMEAGAGYGMASVSQGRLFLFDSDEDECTLHCVNAETGKSIWSYAYESDYQDMYGYDNGPRTSPVVDEDRVYTYGPDGMLQCINVTDGKLKWKVDTAKDFGVVQNFFGVGSTPLVFGDQLLVMVGGSGPEAQQVPPGALNRVKPNGCGVVAFNKLNGKVLYRTIDDLASYSSLRLMKADGKPIVLALMREKLHGFDPVDGKELFSHPFRAKKLESVNAMTPVVTSSDQVFVSECYGPGALLLDIGRRPVKVLRTEADQRKKSMQTHWCTPVVSGEYLFACSGRHPGAAELRCVNWRNGEVMWSEDSLRRSSVVGVDGYLVVLDESGRLLLVEESEKAFRVVTELQDPVDETGKPLKFRSPCWAAPMISHGLMWIRSKDRLVCFDLRGQGKSHQ
jgi:outer membrane protein assembly factor BamB